MTNSKLPEILRRHEGEILNDWIRHQQSSTAVRGNVIREADLREQSRALLAALREGLESGAAPDLNASAWSSTREFIAEVSRARALRRRNRAPLASPTLPPGYCWPRSPQHA